jgi:HlyD family secretion protein
MGNGVTAWIGGHRRWIWLVAGVLVLALLVLGVVRALTAGASDKPKAAATVAVDQGAVTTEVATTGVLQPAQSRSLSFTVDSTVTSVSVRAGSEVTAGQTLAKADTSDAQSAVDDAQTALDQAEAALTSAETASSKATESAKSGSTSTCSGSNVGAAYTITASPSPSPSVSKSATPSPSPSVTKTATATPTRTQTQTRGTGGAPATTSKGGSSSRGGSSSCTTTSGSSGGGQGNSGGGSGGDTDSVLSAQQRVTSANVTLENAEDALDGATITAPIAGRILTVGGKVGTQVNSGSTFITLADVYDMQISADFPEADADSLAVKQKATATLADQAGKTFNCTVVQVDPTGTSDGTMVRYGVLLSFVDAPKDLLVGQSAAVRVTTGSATGVLRVPSTALHGVAGTSATVLKSANGATNQVKVVIGLRGDQYTEIKSGLVAGDTVVSSW